MKRKYLNKISLLTLSAVLLLVISAGCNGDGATPALVSPEGGVSVGLPSPSVSEELADEAWQQRFIFHVGPVDLPAGTKAQDMEEEPLRMNFQTDEDIWVTAFLPRVVDVSGSELPSELLAHAIVSNMHEDNPVCADSGVGNPAFIATSMLTEIELPQGYGYPVLSTDPLQAEVILENPTEESFAGVYFELTLVARPMNDFTNLADVKPMLVEFDPCGHEPIDVEPGAFAEKNVSYKLSESSRVIMVSGALGDYGASLSLTAGEEIAPFWRSEAELDEGHAIVDLTDSPFVDMETTLSAGGEISLSAAYDNTSDSWLKSATAAAMIYVNPTE